MHCKVNYILKHKQYIDYRINIINNNLSSNLSERKHQLDAVISVLMNISANICYVINSPEINQALAELNDIIERWDFNNDGDIIGYIYNNLECKNNLKAKGQYFTPEDVSSYITNSSIAIADRDDIFILDPACGSGQFLLISYKIIYNKQIVKFKDHLKCSAYAISRLYGIDVDPLAVKIARYNLMKISGCNSSLINIFNFNFLMKSNSNLFESSYTDAVLQRKFDIIIGNPPWRSKFTPEEKRYFKSSYSSTGSGINTFTLFLERSFEFINNDGIISFLIPEAYLNIKTHMSSRQYILENSLIKSIFCWGEKFKGIFAPSISIVVQKNSSDIDRMKNIIHVQNDSCIKHGTALLVPQAGYLRTPENIFNINHTRKAVEIISTIESNDCIYLKNRAKFFLGVVTGDNVRHINMRRSTFHSDPIIIGQDVQQYRISFSNHFFKFDPNHLQQVAPQHLYLTKNKILYKFIGKKLTFALDPYGYYSLNNVNGFIPDDIGNNIESTLSILNSHVLQYYYYNNFFTLKVLRSNIEKLPIKTIARSTQKKLTSLVRMIINQDNKSTKIQRETIEDIIFHEYRIKDKDAYTINEMVQ